MQETILDKAQEPNFNATPEGGSLRKRESLRIVSCGNIRVEKSTLCRMLAQEIKGTVVEEKIVENPYLKPYYNELKKNMKPNKYAF